MLEIGKMNPDSISVGRNDVSSATLKRHLLRSAMLEMSRPKRERADQKQRHDAESTTHEPRIGMSNSSIAATTMLIAEIERDNEIRRRLAEDVRHRPDRRHPHLLHRARPPSRGRSTVRSRRRRSASRCRR